MGIEIEEMGLTADDVAQGAGMIPVAGRGMIEGCVWLRPDAGGLVIRVDDAQRPDFWVELVLSESQLLRMLAKVHRLAHSETRPPDPE